MLVFSFRSFKNNILNWRELELLSVKTFKPGIYHVIPFKFFMYIRVKFYLSCVVASMHFLSLLLDWGRVCVVIVRFLKSFYIDTHTSTYRALLSDRFSVCNLTVENFLCVTPEETHCMRNEIYVF